MYPRHETWWDYLTDGLLQASGVMTDAEVGSPQQLDENGHKCLYMVKNSLAMGTTLGCINGLESLTRIYDEHGVAQTLFIIII